MRQHHEVADDLTAVLKPARADLAGLKLLVLPVEVGVPNLLDRQSVAGYGCRTGLSSGVEIGGPILFVGGIRVLELEKPAKS